MHNSIEVEITLLQIIYNISNKHEILSRLLRFENPFVFFYNRMFPVGCPLYFTLFGVKFFVSWEYFLKKIT